ncbi:MAG TPA: ribonuclease HII [Candidatus Bathyarchaeia archaeon]|nr:ribonuclease HII [Candidatus Bathyarchaeia archaeon]
MLIAGVDDAGRGSIIGPLVIAGVVLEENDLPKLIALKVRDSKLLSAKRREELSRAIRRLVPKYHVEKLPPAEIDKVVESHIKLQKLNRLEAQTMAKVIEMLKPDKAYVDASDVIEARYKEHIKERLLYNPEIISEHKADRNYPIVSAASIIAKVERDDAIAELSHRYGEMGCGYPTDPQTLAFLENWLKKHIDYPDFVRKSWKPAKRLKGNAGARQKKLNEDWRNR